MNNNQNSNGLTEAQVTESREKYGSNKLPEPELKKWYTFAREALGEKITLILIAITLLQFLLAFLGAMEYSEPIMIMLVIGIVAGIAVKTGLGVQKSAEELRQKSSLRFCDVIREGKLQRINKDDIVVGDTVCIASGQEIYADGYIAEGKISVNNAAINGESEQCRKTPINGYIHTKTASTDAYTNQNCLFAGTTVVEGEGKMIVTDVGINTINGDTLVKMQTLISPKTALDSALDKLSGFISKWGTLAATVTFLILTVSSIAKIGAKAYFSEDVLSIIQKTASDFSLALTIVVAAVPEGLPLIVKLVTKQNVRTMERFNILAKNPGKIPELAYVNLICTDKTGTLTTGIMTPKITLDYSGRETDTKSNLFKEITKNIALNNSAAFDKNGCITGGNSIDRAVLSMVNPEYARKIISENKSLDRQTFSSVNKYSASSVENITYYKGAPEKIIAACTKAMKPDSSIVDFSDKTALEEKIKELTCKSVRCIAVAFCEGGITENILPDNMTFMGIIGVSDPIRPEVPEAVRAAEKAGIQIIEITGDCIETAVAVAKECGIFKNGGKALTNDEFERLTDEEVKAMIPDLRVIARCSPNTKLRLITLAQQIGMSVAMTGDGVNDSSALKKSDVGFGMHGGSDVAKEAADIILTDDNFASVVKTVSLGRTFMHNIMMFLEFQLPINISLLILSMLYPLFKSGAVLASVQILIINIIMDSLNSLSFGNEPPKDEYMSEKPITKGSGLFVRGAKARIAVSTAAFTAAYAILIASSANKLFANEASFLTARFALMCFMAVINGFNIRTKHINPFQGISKNKLFIKISFGILAGVIAVCSLAGNSLKVCPLSALQWAVIFAISLIVIPIDIFRKIFVAKREKMC